MKLSSEVFSAGANREVLLGPVVVHEFTRKMKKEMWWTHCSSQTINISPASDLLPTLGGFSALLVGWLTLLTPCKMSYATREEGRDTVELNIQRGGCLCMSAIPACHEKGSGFPRVHVPAGLSSWTIRCAQGWSMA